MLKKLVNLLKQKRKSDFREQLSRMIFLNQTLVTMSLGK